MKKRTESEDYRSRADRVNMSRAGKRKMKRRRDALLILSVFVFVCVVAVLGMSILLKVSYVKVENEAIRYTDAQIVEASGVKTEESLFGVKKSAVAARITRALPYIGTANVTIALPDTVKISVTYTKAKLSAVMADGNVLMDAAGKVLQTGVRQPVDYVAELSGVQLVSAVPGEIAVFENEDMLSYVTGLTAAFEENGITGVTAIDFTDLSDIVAELNFNTDVKLGSITKAIGKLRFGKEVIDRTMAQARGTSSKIVIDLTGEDSAFVRSQDDIDAAVSYAQEAATAPTGENALSGESEADVPTQTGANEEPIAPAEPDPTEAPAETEPPETEPPETEPPADETEPLGAVG